MTAILASAALLLALADVPLKTLADYTYTNPNHTNITGKVMGTKPAPYAPLRIEDQIYLYEVWAEMDTVARATPSSTLTVWSGGDDVRLIRQGSRVGKPWHPIYSGLCNNTNVGALVKSGGSVTLPTEFYAWRPSGGVFWTDVARGAVLFSGCAARPLDGMDVLGKPITTSRVLASTNVCVFYRGLAQVAGIANDFNTTNSTNENRTTGKRLWTDCTYNRETGSYTYYTMSTESTGTHIGGGLYENTSQKISVAQNQKDGASKFSSPMQDSSIYSFESEDDVTATICTNAIVQADRITPLNAWLVCSVGYTDFEMVWQSNTQLNYTKSTSTNMMVAVKVEARISEVNGMVIATAKPDYDAVYRKVINSGFTPPDDNYYPPAPTPAAFVDGGNEIKSNERLTDIQIAPRRLALILEVNWRSGIQDME